MSVSNDGPVAVEVLYSGSVSGSFTLAACGTCCRYASTAVARLSAFRDSGKHYPTLRPHRSERKAARTSAAKSSGSSQAAKWPPLPTSLK